MDFYSTVPSDTDTPQKDEHRLLRLKRPVSLTVLTSSHLLTWSLLSTTRIFRLNDIPFFICRRCFKAPRRHKSTQSSTHQRQHPPKATPRPDIKRTIRVPLRRFQSHRRALQAIFRAGNRWALPRCWDSGVMPYIGQDTHSATGRLTRSSIVIKQAPAEEQSSLLNQCSLTRSPSS